MAFVKKYKIQTATVEVELENKQRVKAQVVLPYNEEQRPKPTVYWAMLPNAVFPKPYEKNHSGLLKMEIDGEIYTGDTVEP